MLSRVINLYLKSEFTSTKTKMAELTPAQVEFADRVYAEAEKCYETGGDTIVECYEPWEIVERFKTIADARRCWTIIRERANDVQGY